MSSPLTAGVLTIFGVTGDLAARKLLPSLYHLLSDGLMPDSFHILGTSRRDITVDELLVALKTQLESDGTTYDSAMVAKLGSLMSVLRMNMDEASSFHHLKDQLDALEEKAGTCLNRLFYLAVPAGAFGNIVDAIGQAGLNAGCQHQGSSSRILLEKPFGSDLASAKELIERLSLTFTEDQIYRIDHYLAKETAQNILTFRFENPLFRAVWNNSLIDSITITAAETLGVEGRAGFYEQTGSLRDLIQSHLLQLLALVTMEEPTAPGAAGIHEQKLKLLNDIVLLSAEAVATDTVRAQYAGYAEEAQVPGSTINTFAALKLEIDNDRWRGVPVLMRTGKAMADKVTEITMSFRQDKYPDVAANSLIIRIQPNEGIVLSLMAKRPGYDQETQHVTMDFCYRDSFAFNHVPDAYERVLADAFKGDQTLFTTSAEQLATWAVIQPILDGWEADAVPLETYDKGTWGPSSADTLAHRFGTAWENDTLKVCPIRMPG